MEKPKSINSERQNISTTTLAVNNNNAIKQLPKPLNKNNENNAMTNILKTKPNGFDEKLNNALAEEYDKRHLEEHEEHEKGIPVQVLYSYEPLEDDELTLIKGNIFKNLIFQSFEI